MLPNQGYHPNHPELNIRPADALGAPGPVQPQPSPVQPHPAADQPQPAADQPLPSRGPAPEQPRSRRRAPAVNPRIALILAALAVLVVLGAVFVPRLFNSPSGGSAASWGLSDLSGAWIGNNGQKDVVSAQIGADGITINWDDGEGTTMLYWKGSFPVPEGSQAEKAVTSRASERDTIDLLASQSDTKDFAVRRDRITFSMSALGVTYQVTMRRK